MKNIETTDLIKQKVSQNVRASGFWGTCKYEYELDGEHAHSNKATLTGGRLSFDSLYNRFLFEWDNSPGENLPPEFETQGVLLWLKPINGNQNELAPGTYALSEELVDGPLPDNYGGWTGMINAEELDAVVFGSTSGSLTIENIDNQERDGRLYKVYSGHFNFEHVSHQEDRPNGKVFNGEYRIPLVDPDN